MSTDQILNSKRVCAKNAHTDLEVNAIMGNSEIAKAAFDIIISGIIGNLSTELFKSYWLPHERENVIEFSKNINVDDEELKKYLQTETGKRLMSIILGKVREEIFLKKIKSWGKIASTIITNNEINLDKKEFFISKFAESNEFILHYLVTINEKEIYSTDLWDNNGSIVEKNESLTLGQLYAAVNGLSRMIYSDGKTRFILSKLGKEYLDFINGEFVKSLN